MSDVRTWCFHVLHFAVIMMHTQAVSIAGVTGLKQNSGGLAGGTRLVIQGFGFSSNQNPVGNQVLVGGIPCETIPLHSTETQITCKTPPSSKQTWAPITVFVDGTVKADCKMSSCSFAYYQGNLFCSSQAFVIQPTGSTPSINDLSQSMGVELSRLTMSGSFKNTAALQFTMLPKGEVGSLAATVDFPRISSGQCL
jgi:hypothetical protein